MNKIFVALILVAIVMVSGCTSSSKQNNNETSNQIKPQYFSDTCRWDTDCLLTHCRDSTDYVCRNSIQTLREIKCQDLGGLVSEKNYDLCGCIDGVCKGK